MRRERVVQDAVAILAQTAWGLGLMGLGRLVMAAGLAFLSPFVRGLVFWIGVRMWRFGLRRYRSTGS